ncbi:MAG: 30S ribosomal protein S4 [Akkermansia sp.]|nr:30S ribosomal protein S4 [Akkermansiaceae bacterium]MBQ3144534.1 30S ribosomal protein S4 [Akkermansia sp.]MBQ8517619.1 30S ribosomal protein S4 [Akkermansia sp.]MBR2313805.1 30S ribosomal protein S4 [Akkermansia sp.]
MARYTGPTAKISRRFGVELFGASKAFARRPFPPGQHGARAGRKKKSDYGIMLAEKQKLRFMYGVLEGQFRKYYEEASRRRGVTGDILLQLLELRLDNVIYRLGFASTRAAARQMVSHGHVTVNGRKVNIASYSCKPGDVVAVAAKARSQALANRYVELAANATTPDWIEVDAAKLTGKIARVPSVEEIAPIVNVQLIVELYSR